MLKNRGVVKYGKVKLYTKASGVESLKHLGSDKEKGNKQLRPRGSCIGSILCQSRDIKKQGLSMGNLGNQGQILSVIGELSAVDILDLSKVAWICRGHLYRSSWLGRKMVKDLDP